MDTAIPDRPRLRTTYQEPGARSAQKMIEHMDRNCRIFIAISPFRVIGTASEDGQTDAPPGGDFCCCPTVWRPIRSTRCGMWTSNRGAASCSSCRA